MARFENVLRGWPALIRARAGTAPAAQPLQPMPVAGSVSPQKAVLLLAV